MPALNRMTTMTIATRGHCQRILLLLCIGAAPHKQIQAIKDDIVVVMLTVGTLLQGLVHLPQAVDGLEVAYDALRYHYRTHKSMTIATGILATGGAFYMLYDWNKSRYASLYPHEKIDYIGEVSPELNALVDAFAKGRKDLMGEAGGIITGPPGAGKSLQAEYIAQSHGIPYLKYSYSKLASGIRDGPITNFNDLWGKAKSLASRPGNKHQVCIIIIDEIDSIGRDRKVLYNGLGNWANEESAKLTETFLTTLDASEKDKILVLGTTNFYEAVDEALIRPGRLGLKIEIPALSQDSCEKLFKHYFMKNKALADQLKEDRFAKVFEEQRELIQRCLQEKVTPAGISSAVCRVLRDRAYKSPVESLTGSDQLNSLLQQACEVAIQYAQRAAAHSRSKD